MPHLTEWHARQAAADAGLALLARAGSADGIWHVRPTERLSGSVSLAWCLWNRFMNFCRCAGCVSVGMCAGNCIISLWKAGSLSSQTAPTVVTYQIGCSVDRARASPISPMGSLSARVCSRPLGVGGGYQGGRLRERPVCVYQPAQPLGPGRVAPGAGGRWPGRTSEGGSRASPAGSVSA